MKKHIVVNQSSPLVQNGSGYIGQFMMRSETGCWACGVVYLTPIMSESAYWPNVTSWAAKVDGDSGYSGVIGYASDDTRVEDVFSNRAESTGVNDAYEQALHALRCWLGIAPVESA